MKKVLKRGLLIVGGLVILAASAFVIMMGPRNVIGMLRYDQRREGDLKVGDRAPDAMLVSLNGKSQQPLFDASVNKPTILIFGSFT